MMTILLINIMVFRIAQKQKRRIQTEQASVDSNSNTTDDAKQRLAKIKKNLSIFYACFGCTITYILFWLPVVILWFLIIKNTQYQKHLPILLAIANFNPISDAILIIRFNKVLRNNVKNCWVRLCRRDGSGDGMQPKQTVNDGTLNQQTVELKELNS